MALTLKAKTRSVTGKKVGKLRREGLIPAVLFGSGEKSRDVAVNAFEFSRVERRITSATLLDIIVDEAAPVKAMLHKVQIDPRSAKPLHLELFQVRMDQKMKVDVPVHIVGSALPVENEGGILVVAHNTVEVRCDPNHLVSSFQVDISRLLTFEDHIRAGDLPMPEGVELLTDPDNILVSVMPPRVAEEEEITPGAEMAEPEAAAAETA